MKGLPQDFMHVGIVHYQVYPKLTSGKGPIMETLSPLCDDDFFQAIEVTSHRDEIMRKEAAVLLRRAGKRVIFAAQPLILRGRVNLNAEDPVEHTQALDLVKEAIIEAADWEAQVVTVMSGPDPGEEKRPEATERLIGSLKELCEFSRTNSGPPVLLESFDRSSIGTNSLVGPTVEARAIAHRVAPYYPRFGLVLNLAHLPFLEEDPAEAVRTAAPLLRYVHVGNCVRRDLEHPAYGNQYPAFGSEGGDITVDDVAVFFRALLEQGYIEPGGANVVSFEVKPFAGQTAAEAIDNIKTTLGDAWKRL